MGAHPDCRNDADKAAAKLLAFFGVLSPSPISVFKL